MLLNKEYLAAWRAWIRITEIRPGLKALAPDADIYRLIDELDQLDLRVNLLGEAAISGAIEECVQGASEELISLARLEAELRSCDVSEKAREEIIIYIASTTTLLEAMLQLSTKGNP